MTPEHEKLVASVEGAIGMGEALMLYNEASKVPNDQCIVEIGSWRGRSTVALAHGSMSGNGARVYSIDPHEKHDSGRGLVCSPDDWPVWSDNMWRCRCWSVVRPIGLPSSECEPHMFGAIGLVFVDGEHSYEAVREDLLFAVDSDGLIIMDDYALESVRRAMDEFRSRTDWRLKQTYGSFAILERNDGVKR